MLINIIDIGNSQGIRIPKSILKQCHIKDKVEMEIEEDKIILKPLILKPRKGWDIKFKQMNAKGDDDLIIEDSVDLQMEKWEW